jgi:hypothetical protein
MDCRLPIADLEEFEIDPGMRLRIIQPSIGNAPAIGNRQSVIGNWQ